MTEIPLTRGHVAIVDDDDASRVSAAGRWQYNPSGRGYAQQSVRIDGRKTTVGLHNFITGWPFVDHINGDGLDNRRSNLRPADRALNARNTGARAHNRSGYKGVSWRPALQRWVARIRINGRGVYLGLHDTPEDAARAYDAAARELHGDYAGLNFPGEAAS